MNPQLLFELYLALCLSGLLAALTIGERSILSYLGWLGSLASWAMFGTGVMGIAGSAFEIRLWSLPPHETFILALDPLSGLFLCVSALVFLPVSIYSGGYIRHYAGLFSLRSLCACYFGLMITVGLQSRALARQRQERGVAVNRRLSPSRRCLNPFHGSVSSTPSSNRT